MNHLNQKLVAMSASLDNYQNTTMILVGVGELLISWLLFQSVTMQITYLFCSLILTFFVMMVLNLYQLNFFLKPLIIAIAGGVGMLIGSIIDFGQLGLLMLKSLCITSLNSNNFEPITQMVALAPWAHIGMWLSCSISMLIVDSRYSLLSVCGSTKHIFCLVGMLLGMLLIHALPANLLPFFKIYPVAVMWLGMSAGMLGFYLLFDRLITVISSRSVDVNLTSVD